MFCWQNYSIISSAEYACVPTPFHPPLGSQRNGARLLGIVGATFEQGGVEIVDIDPDGSAALAGLKIGDVINSVDGKRVRSMPALAAALERVCQLGCMVRIGYMFRNPSFGLMQGADKTIALNRQ